MNTKLWRIEFDESGGYDCTSSAWHIYEGEGYEQLITTVDCGDYDDVGNKWCAPSAMAEENARFIVEVVNQRRILMADAEISLDAIKNTDLPKLILSILLRLQQLEKDVKQLYHQEGVWCGVDGCPGCDGHCDAENL